MFSKKFSKRLDSTLAEIRDKGFWKEERIIASPQDATVLVPDTGKVINLCANNYLGLADDPRVLEAARAALDERGFGMASVRFICGTQDIHKELEAKISSFLGMEDTILYPSCFDANGGLFESLLGLEDAIVSDSLNHASIIDGVRLCKAKRYRYASSDMDELRARLRQADADGAKTKIIATDGVFSMDGVIANLPGICDLAEEFGALVMMDDCHGMGFLGPSGRGSHEYHDVMGRVDIITGTLGKALGGASGGFTSSSRKVVDLLRQRSRPYLFSNSVAPPIVAASLKVFELLEESDDLRRKLWDNTEYFRGLMQDAGFGLGMSQTPIVPVMIYDAQLAKQVAERLLKEGIYVIAFSYPVVPEGKARIRCQVSAAHSKEELKAVADAFVKIRGM